MATIKYTALEKLYGLKLHQGKIKEADIPASCKEKAVKYSKTL